MTSPDMQEPDDAPLAIRLFGPFDARVHGEPLPHLRSRKGAWLLALLVLRAGRAVQRSWVAGTLWPESAEADALYSLRRSLTDLRSALGPEAVRIQSPTPQTLRLDLTGCWADVVGFDAVVGSGEASALASAVELHRAPFLEGCNEDWCLSERAFREEARMSALERLARLSRDQGDRAREVHWLRHLLAADPYRESAVKELLGAHTASGDCAAAVRVYLDFRRLLKRELGTEPAADLQALLEKVQQLSKSELGNARGRSRQAGATPMTEPLTPLLGRESELAAIAGMLDECRLLTLVGAGGIGKTRLAIEAAKRERGDDQRAAFADLSSVSAPSAAIRELMRAVGDWDLPREPDLTDLLRVLASRPTLLVVDNCEHLVESLAPLLADILRSCSDLRVLATSRQALRVAGERLFAVPPLPLEAEDIATMPSVQLFCLHAAAADPGFTLNQENSAAIAKICRRLEGIPLAIELAAARVRLLSTEQIAARLDHRLALLEGGSRDAPERHRTLRAALAWSYDLLEPAEQRLFRRLALPIGTWDLDAARALGGSGAETRLEGLIEKSLVIGEEDGPERRFRMLETLREFGLERLSETGEAEETREALVDWAVALAESAAKDLRLPKQREALALLDQAHANLLRALEAAPEVKSRMRLAASLWRYWDVRGYWTDGLHWLCDAASNVDIDSAVSAEALLGLGVLRRRRGDLAGAEEALSRSGELFGDLESSYGKAAVLHEQGLVSLLRGDLALSDVLYGQSWVLAEADGDLVHLAALANDRGELARAQGRFDQAETLFAKCLDLSRRLDDLRGMAGALANLGNLAAEREDYDDALLWGSQSLEYLTALGDRWGRALVLNNLGFAHVGLGNSAESEALFREAADLRLNLGDLPGLAHSLAGLSAAASLRCDDEQAAFFAGTVDALRDGEGIELDPVDRRMWECRIVESRRRLGEEAFRKAWRRGRYADRKSLLGPA